MSQASRLWLWLAGMALLTTVVMGGFVGLLIISMRSDRTLPSNPVVQPTTPIPDRLPIAADFARRQGDADPQPIPPATTDAAGGEHPDQN